MFTTSMKSGKFIVMSSNVCVCATFCLCVNSLPPRHRQKHSENCSFKRRSKSSQPEIDLVFKISDYLLVISVQSIIKTMPGSLSLYVNRLGLASKFISAVSLFCVKCKRASVNLNRDYHYYRILSVVIVKSSCHQIIT